MWGLILTRKNVLITGVNRGIGKAALELFLLEGYNVIGTIRQISMTVFLYTFSMTNNPYFGFFLTLLANFYGIFIKKYIIILAFPNISINCNNNKVIYLLEIFRSSFNDFLTFKLLYNFSYSPFLK